MSELKKEADELFVGMMRMARFILRKDGFDMMKFVDLTDREKQMLENPTGVWPLDLTGKLLPPTQKFGRCRERAYFLFKYFKRLFKQVILDKTMLKKLNKKIDRSRFTVYEIFEVSLDYISLSIISPSGTTYEFTSTENLEKKLSETIKQITVNEPKLKDRLLADEIYFYFVNGHTNINFETFLLALYMLDYKLQPNIK